MTTYRTPIGDMRKRICIELLATDGTADAETSDTPNVLARALARILPMTGQETWLSRELQEMGSHRLNLRFQNVIMANRGKKLRAIHAGRVFNFLSVRDLEERHEEIEIIAKEPISE